MYYGQRAGGAPPKLDFDAMRRLVVATYAALETAGWFQEWFGYQCVDGDVIGKAGPDRSGFIYTQAWLLDMWPLRTALAGADHVTLFTLVELLYDCVSEPIEGRNHDYHECGMHFNVFNGRAGQERWRSDINRILPHFEDGYVLSEDGKAERQGAAGLRELMAQPLPIKTPRTDREKVEAAVKAYRHFSASREERADAVRHLVALLEYYRREVVKKSVLSKDEDDLFTIANKFAIRHYRDDQKSDYSDDWLDWLFHLYLSTVHLTLRLAHGSEPAAPEPDDELPF